MKPTFIFIIILCLSSCTSTTKQVAYSPSQLVGTWELKFDGRYPYWFSQIGFTEEGRKCVLSYEFDAKGRVDITYYANRYVIENGHLISTVEFSNTEYVPKGYVIKDRIDNIDTNGFEVFMVGPLMGSTPEIHQRLIDVAPEEICKIVDNFRITSA
ncbi:hypothetical protein FX988_00601 [Paraglaciecola mesophila]|uniref:Lipocalin-like domain-containing protein n=1 Tax=Paraglaciecola mesophila TaxID=197222 RepID=A0A857JEE0_9ALTE|nr:hypothetical protein [Paraglaciecola mesophila]QHJ10389.1 hypothetical protein FX988_00601 [Paraglaciecola mesophila]